MRVILLLVMLVFSASAISQDHIFIRVFNDRQVKSAKGYFVSADDSTLVLMFQKQFDTVSLAQIKTVKTARSAGHNMAWGATTGFAAGLAVGIAGASGAGDGWGGLVLLASTIGGTTAGTTAGLLSCAFKNSKTFAINGDTKAWQEFRQHIISRQKR